jgi:hypothetical protein
MNVTSSPFRAMSAPIPAPFAPVPSTAIFVIEVPPSHPRKAQPLCCPVGVYV